jgi:solute carrier family 25 (peroxisomal adenine nucleotide transporter), member 17
VEELGLGFVAGLASKLISTPLSVITVRLQTEREDVEEGGGETSKNSVDFPDDEMRKVGGVRDVIRRIYEENGLVGFWRGLLPFPYFINRMLSSINIGFSSMIPLALTPSLTLFLFQLFRGIFLPVKNRERPTPGQAFIGGAIAQSISESLANPAQYSPNS